MAWLVGSMTRLRDAQSHAIALAIIVVAISFAAVAIPRFLSGTSDGLLRETLESARSEVRDLTFIEEGRIGALREEPFAQVDAARDHVLADVPDGLAAVLEPALLVVDTSRWVILGEGRAETTVRLRIQQGAEASVRVVDGRLPTERTSVVERDDDPAGTKPPVTFFEIALSRESAQELGVSIGDRVVLELDRTDRLSVRPVSIVVQYDNRTDARVGVEVAGIFDVPAPADGFWFDDHAIERPVVRSIGGDTRFLDITALIAPEAYPAFIAATNASGVPLRYTWRLAVNAERIHSEQVAGLLDDLRRLETIFPSAGAPLSLPNAAALRTSLQPLLLGFVEAWGSVEAVLTVVLVGAATIALGALMLTVVLLVRRRRTTMELLRRRGASGRQLASTAALEGFVIATPGAVVGGLLAVAAFPRGTDALAIGAAVVITVIALLVVLGDADHQAGTRTGNRDRPGRPAGGPRRLALEGALVFLAGVTAYLARERGLEAASSARELVGSDPLVAAAPALVGVAAGVVAQRLFPIPALVLARLTARRRDLVPALAMRRLARGSSSGTVLIALIAAAAVATFSSATLTRVDGLAGAVAQDQVGVPFRIDVPEGRFSAELDPASLPGVEAAAVVYAAPGNLANGTRVAVLAIDPVSMARVLGDEATGGIPAEFVGEAVRPVPAIVSASLGERPTSLAIGDTFSLTVAGYATTYLVVAVRDAFPTIDASRFVVAAREQLQAALPGARIGGNRALLVASDDQAANLHAAIAAADPAAVLTSRAELAAAIRSGPAVTALTAGIVAAAIMAAVFAALAVTVALVMFGAGEAAQTAQLRALGLTTRQSAQLLVLEQAPVVTVALAGGLALGLGLFALLQPGLTLESIVGGMADIPFSIDSRHVALTLAGTTVVVAIGLIIASVLQGRAAPATAIRQAVDE